MKQNLIILAHPSKSSFAKKMYDEIRKAFPKSKIINLYTKNNRQGFLDFENIKDIEVSKSTAKFQDEIKKADNLVILFPVWWGYIPAILKNFFDNTLTSGFAFKYKKDGQMEKLLAGKTAQVFYSYDDSKLFYTLQGNPIKTILKYNTLEFCGLKVTAFDGLGSFRKQTENNKNKFIQKSIKKIGKSLK